MKKRPAGIRAFIAAAESHHVDTEAYRAFHASVYYSYGTRSHPRWGAMKDRLASLFEDFTAEPYDGLHHLNTSHQAEPERVAAALKRPGHLLGEACDPPHAPNWPPGRGSMPSGAR